MKSQDCRYGVLATFSFHWQNGQLNIFKTGTKTVDTSRSSSPRGVGCGKTINWKEMAPFPVPPEFNETGSISVDDINLLPTGAKLTWDTTFRTAQSKAKMKVHTVNK